MCNCLATNAYGNNRRLESFEGTGRSAKVTAQIIEMMPRVSLWTSATNLTDKFMLTDHSTVFLPKATVVEKLTDSYVAIRAINWTDMIHPTLWSGLSLSFSIQRSKADIVLFSVSFTALNICFSKILAFELVTASFQVPIGIDALFGLQNFILCRTLLYVHKIHLYLHCRFSFPFTSQYFVHTVWNFVDFFVVKFATKNPRSSKQFHGKKNWYKKIVRGMGCGFEVRGFYGLFLFGPIRRRPTAPLLTKVLVHSSTRSIVQWWNL